MKGPYQSLVPSPPLKIRFYSYLAENSQKATLNFSRLSVKPSKFQINLQKIVDITLDFKLTFEKHLKNALDKNVGLCYLTKTKVFVT